MRLVTQLLWPAAPAVHREMESYNERLTLVCVFTGGKIISVDVPGGRVFVWKVNSCQVSLHSAVLHWQYDCIPLCFIAILSYCATAWCPLTELEKRLRLDRSFSIVLLTPLSWLCFNTMTLSQTGSSWCQACPPPPVWRRVASLSLHFCLMACPDLVRRKNHLLPFMAKSGWTLPRTDKAVCVVEETHYVHMREEGWHGGSFLSLKIN